MNRDCRRIAGSIRHACRATRLRVVTFGFLILCFSSTVYAANPSPADAPKKPWEWTAAERAAARRDPARRLERVRASMSSSHTLVGQRAPFDVIDGTRNPELFFPTELFEMLVRSSFVLLPTTYPHVIRQRSTDLFKNPAEWDEFVVIVRDYANVIKQEASAANAIDSKRVSELQGTKCAVAARALREARKKFGRERVDRMLYETVSTTRSFGWDTDLEKSIGNALSREERCQ